MKKTLIAIALAAMMAPAWGAEVVSSNIVGYEKLELDKNVFVMGATQFQKVGGKSGTLSDLFSADDIPYGTEIRFMDTTGHYQYFKYLEEAYDEDLDDFIPGWADGFENLVTDPVDPGTGFWVSVPKNYDLTQAGQVATNRTIQITLTPGMFEMVSNPFPDAFNPNAVTWGNLEYGTEIRVLDATGHYQYFKYLEEAYDEDLDDFVPGWADGFENLVSDAIAPVGQSFWIRSVEDDPVTITFTNPSPSSN